jgi:alkanesulfonate monooxygenase SsuD/methylene tetrahydromethanopterin reductase-like flavin-dependent oxidoreductase (luciferase family)
MDNVIELPGIALTELAAWARRAEAAGYDAIVAPDHPGAEPLVALAAVAAATERIELITTLVTRPERTTSLLVKQAATLDVLSGGRLTIGLELAERAEDLAGAVAPLTQFPDRRLAGHVEALRALWPGRVVSGRAHAIAARAPLAVAA